ncbi:TPA: hypothetical protein OOH72_001487 [Enterococcus faecium]|nr:hypothetical protein [Enterococcus faecium]HBM5733168.1 hypothetical protein [Enterococcus faecium]HBM5909585.1 hypothetical protein [Enterococcus faecium]HBM6614710.1 hypothetical protein [Enterococcus faecium]HBM7119506.1 hypothetical protein [Enterococcus faecium]
MNEPDMTNQFRVGEVILQRMIDRKEFEDIYRSVTRKNTVDAYYFDAGRRIVTVFAYYLGSISGSSVDEERIIGELMALTATMERDSIPGVVVWDKISKLPGTPEHSMQLASEKAIEDTFTFLLAAAKAEEPYYLNGGTETIVSMIAAEVEQDCR